MRCILCCPHGGGDEETDDDDDDPDDAETPPSSEDLDCEVLIVGAGPCGVIATAALLERFGSDRKKCGWIEGGKFDAVGRLSVYESVPGNAPNGKICEVLRSLECLDFDKRQEKRRPEALVAFDPEGTCEIRYAVDALRDGSQAIRESGRLKFALEHCRAESFSFDGFHWCVDCSVVVPGAPPEPQVKLRIQADRVLVAPGARPRHPDTQLEIPILPHDAAVCPALCKDLDLSSIKRVGVVGASHSGMLAAKNLVEFHDVKVVVYAKKGIRFADGSKFHGLRGQVASWVRQYLRRSPVTVVDVPTDLADLDVDAVVFTWGFDRVPFPPVTYLGNPIHVKSHNTRNGRLAPGLHGVGIAFPEHSTDPDGHTEPIIGFVFHFQAHLDRVFDSLLRPIFKDSLQQHLEASAFSSSSSSISTLS